MGLRAPLPRLRRYAVPAGIASNLQSDPVNMGQPVPETSPAFREKTKWFGTQRSYERVRSSAHNEVEMPADPIVLDLDDISTAAAGSSATGLGTALQVTILFVGGALAFYGTASAIEQLLVSSKKLKALHQRSKAIDERLRGGDRLIAIHARHVSPALKAWAQANRADAMLTEQAMAVITRRMGRGIRVKQVFSGAIAAAGTFLMGTGVFLNPAIWGLIPTTSAAKLVTLGAISATVLWVAIPLISLFGLGNMAQHLSGLVQTARLPRSQLASLPKDICNAIVRQRRAANRTHLWGVLSFAGLALGAPLTLALGPVGLAVLLPGVVAIVYTDYLQKKHIVYQPRLTLEEAAALQDEEDLFDALRATEREIALIESVASQKMSAADSVHRTLESFKRQEGGLGDSLFSVGELARWMRREGIEDSVVAALLPNVPESFIRRTPSPNVHAECVRLDYKALEAALKRSNTTRGCNEAAAVVRQLEDRLWKGIRTELVLRKRHRAQELLDIIFERRFAKTQATENTAPHAVDGVRKRRDKEKSR